MALPEQDEKRSHPTLRTADGVALRRHEWSAERRAAHVLLLHGYAEHAGRYEWVARRLADQHGCWVHAVDLRGHGHSDGPRGHVARFADYHQDVDALLAHARDADPTLPVVLLGHSMGGLLATDYLQQRDGRARGIRAAALTSPYFGLQRPLWWAERTLVAVLSRLAPRAGLPVKLGGAELCSDPDIARAHDADPLIFYRATARWIGESLAAHARTLEGAAGLTLPMLVLYGTDDCIASPEATARLVGRLPRAEAEALEEKHELLNAAEPTRPQLVDRIGHWLAAQAADHSTSR